MNEIWELEEWKDSVSKVLDAGTALEKSLESLNNKANQLEKASERLGMLEALAENVARERLLSRLDQDTKFEHAETERLLQGLGLRK